jgi:predicted amidophosphoribosyltransferase
VEYHPEKLPGPWRAGFALDRHTIRSEYLGADSFGNPVYETVRSPLGELVFKLKYRRDKSALNPIVEVAVDFLKKWSLDIQLIVPVPPSNEGRKHQPVSLIAEGLAQKLGVELCNDCIQKSKPTGQLKDIHVYAERVKVLRGAFSVRRAGVQGRRVLLVDDLFRSGATLSALTEALYNCRVSDVFVLTITKTRVRQ